MSRIEMRVPDIGSDSAEVIELCVTPGETIKVDDSIVVLESSKATMEVPATQAGTVLEMCVSVGDEVSEGSVLLILESAESSEVAPVVDNLMNTPAVEDSDLVPVLENAVPAPPVSAIPAVSARQQVKDSLEIVNIPNLGGASSVTVIEVCARPGQRVEKDDPLVVLESDKASMEIGAPEAGVLESMALALGDEVQEGDLVATLLIQARPNEDHPPEAVPLPVLSDVSLNTAPVHRNTLAAATATDAQNERSDPRVHAGPAVRKIAREFGVDLAQVKGSGPKDRVLKEDLQGFVKQSLQKVGAAATTGLAGTALPAIKLPDFSQFGAVTRRPMSKIHQATAHNMTASWLNIPHVTQFDEADISELESFRKAQSAVAKTKDLKLTILPFLLKACAYALTRLPQFNVSLDMGRGEVVQKSYCHIGVAVDTPAGLVVPVIRNVDQKSIWSLAQETLELANKAKNRQLKPADMQGGCFTISSLGSVGGTAFTPIVNAPEVAILGVSKATIKPWWDGQQFQPRLMLPLSLSYDHRAVNGADAARFTTLLGTLLADIRELLL
ncbi:MAG: dihydrolipoyllysine-residue acetyltransferase [Hahellaceae bacterium]|nr:dihydrolipoyllysine-residue acetyltransferase [Hahellaceae bacterium]MCP5168784.1 dihydrolipoyllysine-residue acetyltransferase [Hahellaceae bacterium]